MAWISKAHHGGGDDRFMCKQSIEYVRNMGEKKITWQKEIVENQEGNKMFFTEWR